MTRPDIDKIEMHHAWTEGVIAQPYETLAARPFLVRDPLIDAQQDRAALLIWVRILENRLRAIAAVAPAFASEAAELEQPAPPESDVSQLSIKDVPRDVDNETGKETDWPADFDYDRWNR